jgi:hypothetical protein
VLSGIIRCNARELFEETTVLAIPASPLAQPATPVTCEIDTDLLLVTDRSAASTRRHSGNC